MFALLSSVALVLLASSLSLVSATAVHDSFCLDELTTCRFTITFPNATQTPYTSELIHGTFTYDSHKPVASPYAGYPKGFMLESLHGERVLFKGNEATRFRIVSLIPAFPGETNYTGYTFDNLFFPNCSVPDHMDRDGWMFIVAREHCPQSRQQTRLIPVNVFANNGVASQGRDLIDLAGGNGTEYGTRGVFVHLECNGRQLCKPHKTHQPCHP